MRSPVLSSFYHRFTFECITSRLRFPSVDLATGWQFWWLGNPARKIIPLCKISPHDLTNIKVKNTFAQWKYVMQKLHDELVKNTNRQMPNRPTRDESFFFGRVKDAEVSSNSIESVDIR
ncbi:hypothetical protein AC1031_007233 [Aphanomyces cochlioides]|nr:hypothetical protein AC1031_007233 [Aphanomyces cochlioides]